MNNTGTRGSTFSLGVSWVVEESEDSQLLGIMGGDTVTLALGTCSFIKNIRLWFLRIDLPSGVSTTKLLGVFHSSLILANSHFPLGVINLTGSPL